MEFDWYWFNELCVCLSVSQFVLPMIQKLRKLSNLYERHNNYMHVSLYLSPTVYVRIPLVLHVYNTLQRPIMRKALFCHYIILVTRTRGHVLFCVELDRWCLQYIPRIIMNDCITTTKQSTTKPCAYFLGYTVILPDVLGTWYKC